jgi:hypothetical protein
LISPQFEASGISNRGTFETKSGMDSNRGMKAILISICESTLLLTQ